MSWDVLGHEWAAAMLRGHLAGGQARHAYLFTGARGVGRRTLALRFAQAINCTQPPEPGEPCGACRACVQTARMQYTDLAILQPENPGAPVKIDAVRELTRTLVLAPYESSHRVALLLDFQNANTNAQNALLKTLEEAPPKVILLLTAESGEQLLPTIVSRCEVLLLRPLPLARLQDELVSRWQIAPGEAALLAHLASGRVGTALGLHQQPELLQQRQAALDDLAALLPANRIQRFAYADKMTNLQNKTGEERERIRLRLRDTLIQWLGWWRDVMISASGESDALINIDRRAEIETAAAHLPAGAGLAMTRALQDVLEGMDSNLNLRLLLEVLMLDLPVIELSVTDPAL